MVDLEFVTVFLKGGEYVTFAATKDVADQMMADWQFCPTDRRRIYRTGNGEEAPFALIGIDIDRVVLIKTKPVPADFYD